MQGRTEERMKLLTYFQNQGKEEEGDKKEKILRDFTGVAHRMVEEIRVQREVQ